MSIGVFPGITPRLMLAAGESETYQSYRSGGGYADEPLSGEELIEAIEAAGLRGRGGAAFPTGAKLRSVRDRSGPRFVVANGEEGEPASVKDRWLLRNRPHLVLDGLRLVAEAVGAERAYVYLSDPVSARSVTRALEEGDLRQLPIELLRVDPTYVAGEETSVIRAIGGGPPLPLDKPPRPYEAGVEGQPTLVANVETLANVPGIATGGADSYRALGSDDSPGTFLATISGACGSPGLYEVPFGLPMREVLERTAGLDSTPRGILMGGFFGGILGSEALEVRLGYDEVRALGSGLGCGALIVLGEDDCPVAAAADVMSYFKRENADQCGACIRGTGAMRDVLIALARGTVDHDDLERLRGWSVSLQKRGACALLDGAAALAGTLFREFPEVMEEHISRPCPRCAALLPSEGIPTETRFAVDVPTIRNEVL